MPKPYNIIIQYSWYDEECCDIETPGTLSNWKGFVHTNKQDLMTPHEEERITCVLHGKCLMRGNLHTVDLDSNVVCEDMNF